MLYQEKLFKYALKLKQLKIHHKLNYYNESIK